MSVNIWYYRGNYKESGELDSSEFSRYKMLFGDDHYWYCKANGSRVLAKFDIRQVENNPLMYFMTDKKVNVQILRREFESVAILRRIKDLKSDLDTKKSHLEHTGIYDPDRGLVDPVFIEKQNEERCLKQILALDRRICVADNKKKSYLIKRRKSDSPTVLRIHYENKSYIYASHISLNIAYLFHQGGVERYTARTIANDFDRMTEREAFVRIKSLVDADLKTVQKALESYELASKEKKKRKKKPDTPKVYPETPEMLEIRKKISELEERLYALRSPLPHMYSWAANH